MSVEEDETQAGSSYVLLLPDGGPGEEGGGGGERQVLYLDSVPCALAEQGGHPATAIIQDILIQPGTEQQLTDGK